MRYDVRRSKVHLINKLSRRAKLWKNKKGTEEQVQKNQYKAERVIKEISVVNQLNDDDISKFALNTTTEELQEIQNDIKLLLATRAMAKLAAYKFVAASVEVFRTNHPDWQELLPSLFEKLNKSKKKKQVKNDKISKPVVVNNSHKSAENLNSGDIKSLEEDHFNKGHESNNENYPEERNKNKERIPCSKTFKEDASEDVTNDRNKINVTDRTGNYSLAVHSRNIHEENVSKDSDTESENKTSDEMKAVDPFFITMDNEEYISTQVPTLVKSENITDFFQIKTYKSDNITLLDKKSTSTEKRKHFKSKNNLFNQCYKHDNNASKKFQSNKHELNSKTNSSGAVHRNRSVHQSSEHGTLKQEKLHPSWEAKKKLSSVAVFEGKKIKFDDD